MRYKKVTDGNNWVITEHAHDYERPQKAVTFAFDTETQIYFDGVKRKPSEMKKLIEGMKDDEKRKRITNKTWSWQCYDEFNGFFMTNDFETFLSYACACGYKFGWCYNATFDFSQIDYEILSNPKWKQHEKGANTKGQPYTYNSVHNDMGARYSYKLWFPYRNLKNRHKYTHAVEIRDFMKFIGGGLEKLLSDLKVTDNDGNDVRKLKMDYQDVDPDHLTENQIAYCENDVKGLYFAVKKFNETIEETSAGECHIFGEKTNLMTAGGFSKRMLLKSLYPEKEDNRKRLQAFQRDHYMNAKLDDYYRRYKLYRGGISYVNPRYKGRLLTSDLFGRPMARYDVNSEYPFSMASIRDLVGKPRVMKMDDWIKTANKDDFEAIYVLHSVSGSVKKGMLGFWYNPFEYDFVDEIDIDQTQLVFERELIEMSHWYDLTYECDDVIVYRRGGFVYNPFVEKFYEIKRQAKKDGNATLQMVAKLLLNSSYGKLAERIERNEGHYEINQETGAVHFVRDGTETDEKSVMSVVVGALVTSFARCYILSKIREICADDVAGKFVYIDTDSIHAFADYPKADAFVLGGLKLEAECEAVKYIAPKTYVDVEKINADGSIDWEFVEIHSKGVNRKAIYEEMKKSPITLASINELITYGKKFTCLVAMNVVGGKALLPTEKYLARIEQAPVPDSWQSYNSMVGEMFVER